MTASASAPRGGAAGASDTPYRRKLIEIDLPLDAINAQSAREKSLRHGHPSTLHLWWARRPLAACRAVVFASMVDDPEDCPEEFPTREDQDAERARLHKMIADLVEWESTDERKPEVRSLLADARWEIARSAARSPDRPPVPPRDDPAAVLRYLAKHVPPVYDPFAGGGSIPLEAQRLGLRAMGTDLNPVAVLINKALIELPPKFTSRPPVNPDADPMGMTTGKGRNARQVSWRGAAGLADDIRWYGRWMRERAWERIGQLYPKAQLPSGGEATVIAWLWARTIPCRNPACGVAMPLMKTFQLSRKEGNEHWTRPVFDQGAKSITFEVQDHPQGVPEGATVDRNSATCLVCGSSAPLAYVREQSRAGKLGEQMTGIVVEGDRQRSYVSPSEEHVRIALAADPEWRPEQKMPSTAHLVSGRGYGITHWHQLFTKRQLTVLTTFVDLLAEARALMVEHGADDEHAGTVATYLALAIGRTANSCSSYARWDNAAGKGTGNLAGTFSRQAIPMIWDFAEANPFSTLTQNWVAQVEWVAKATERLPLDANPGEAHQADAASTVHGGKGPVIVTDPPYYDNISYAELSDFFYVWLRPALRDTHPDLFASMLAPIDEEIVVAPRFDDPRERFVTLLNKTLDLIRQRCTPEFPSSIFYAYKQQEEQREGRTSTGWETMLSALVSAGFMIIGTWPMRTELANRVRAMSTNSLATSVVLVCRPRAEDAPVATRREFLDALDAELPAALDHLTREGHIAPVDLAQAAIGPGMEVYSRYRRVETIAGEPVTVREALQAINRAVAEYHRREQGNLDAPSRFCVDWLRQRGYAVGLYGDAHTLAQAMNVGVEALASAGLLTAEGGEVALRPPDAFAHDPQLRLDGLTAWEGCFRMGWHLTHEHGEGVRGAARVARAMSDAGSAERLARILYEHFDRTADSRRAVLCNQLVTSWGEIETEMLHGERQLGLGA